MTVSLTAKEKTAIRNYWTKSYYAVRVRADGTVEAQQRPGAPWGILEGPESAKESAKALLDR